MPESTDNDTMYSIGALSKMVGVSADTLRYYDEIGLFKPAKTSPETGYRYYTNDQSTALSRIMELKYYGFSLNEIKKILNQEEVSLTDVYLNRYWALENEKIKLQEAIDELSEKIKQIQEDFIMKKRIIIVDDAAFMRSVCKELLVREGYVVVGEACDGLEAVELYKSVKPDIVLLDIVMPNCDGIDALRKIREYDNDVHAIMISAMSQARVIAEALLEGAREFINKPFQAEKLIKKIKESFNQTRAVNREIAQQIYDACVDDKDILATHEVENIVKLIYSQADAKEVESSISQLKESHWALENEKSKLQKAIDGHLEKINQKQEDFIMNKRIMIVDDASFMRAMCKDILVRKGYDVVGEACDGLEAVELYKSLKPDIVLLDIVMPNCDGIDALRRIKEYDDNVNAIMLSAMSQARMIAESLLAGARGFITKPFQSEELINKINSSFHQTRVVNREIAQQIYDANVNDTYILAAHEVERIVKIIYSQADIKEVEASISQLKERSPAEQQGYDPTIDQQAHINARLDRLEQGQEKILNILYSLKNNN